MIFVVGCCACAYMCMCGSMRMQSCVSRSPSPSSPLCGPHWCLSFLTARIPCMFRRSCSFSSGLEPPHPVTLIWPGARSSGQFLIWPGATSLSQGPGGTSSFSGLAGLVLHSPGLKPAARPQCTSTACLVIPKASCNWVLVHTPISVPVVPGPARMITPDHSRPGVLEILPRESATKFTL